MIVLNWLFRTIFQLKRSTHSYFCCTNSPIVMHQSSDFSKFLTAATFSGSCLRNTESCDITVISVYPYIFWQKMSCNRSDGNYFPASVFAAEISRFHLLCRGVASHSLISVEAYRCDHFFLCAARYTIECIRKQEGYPA